MTKVKVGLGCLLELLKKEPIVKIVSELPPKETAELNFIYLVPKDNAGQDKRAYVLRPDRSGYDAIDLSPQVIDVIGEGLITVKKEVHNENGDVMFTVTTSPSFQAVLDSLTAKDKELDTKVSALEAKDAVHEAKLSAIEAKDSEQDTRLEALKAHDDQVDDALEAVGKTIKETVDLIDAKVLELKKDNERQDGALDDLGESVKDLNESVQHLDEEHGKSIADLQKDSQGLKELTSELDNSINEINDQLKLLDGGLEEEVKAIHTEVEDITNAVTEIENRTDKLAKDAEDKSKAQAEKDGSQDAEIEALKKKDAEVETALETLGETLGKTVDLIDHKAEGLDTRVKALESKEDSDKQTLAIAGNKLSISNGNEVDLPQYDDTAVKDAINHLGDGLNQAMDYTEQVKNYVDSKADALTLVLGTAKADADTKVQGFDTRLQAIEAKEDSDKQTLSLTDHTLSISNGNSVELPKYDDTVVKVKNTEQDEELKALKEKTKSFLTDASVTRQGNVITLTYTNIDGTSTNLEFNDNDTKAIAYDDTALKARVQDLENRADNDTIYNDAPIKERITALENKPDKDTVYDDAPLKERLTALETKVDKDTVYDDSAVTARLTALETKEDKDTVYNDEELRNKITALEGKTDNFVSNVGVSREGNTVKLTYTMVNGDNKEVSFTDNDTVSVAYDDSALRGRVEALENKPEVEYELVKTTKAVTPSQGEGVINLASEATTDPLKELVLTGNVSAKVKSPFGGDETTVAGKVGFNSGTTGDAIIGSHTTAVSENVYVEFYYTDSTVKAYLVYESDNENEVVKYHKALSLAELQGTEPARISISKANVEQGYVEVTFTGVALNMNSYKVQKKG